jgi:peptide/nickel transport system ATP-binding protein/oligopeptide transport system ATP-binding protein
MRLVTPTAGSIRLNSADITHLSRRALRPLRRSMHMVFQDPYSSLDPRMTCGQIVGEPLDVQGLARALAVSPALLVADEPVSALDVSVQASILNLLRDLQDELGFSCLFITHDLATVEYLCDRVAVMYLGQIVELAPTRELFASPKHPYTQSLLSAGVVPDPEVQRARSRVVLEGDLPSPLDPPSGCRFRTRCPLEPRSAPQSHDEEPSLVDTGDGHLVACHLVRRGETPELYRPVEVAG